MECSTVKHYFKQLTRIISKKCKKISDRLANKTSHHVHWHDVPLKTSYIEFVMAGNYSTIGVVEMCSHWARGQ